MKKKSDKATKVVEEQEPIEIGKEVASDEIESTDDELTDDTESDDSVEDKCEDAVSELDKLKIELEVEKDKRLRTMAEFANFRRRTNSNYTKFTQDATERVVLHLLPILDDFDRMFQQDLSKMSEETVQLGFQMIHRKIKDKLGALELTPIESEGKLFNVDEHEAISEIESVDVEPGTIITEVEKGYRLKDKVIRHAKVIVGRLPEEENGGTDEEVSDE